MSDLFTPEVRRNPFPLYEQLRSVSPVFREPRLGLWMILDYDGVKRALNDPEVFSSRAAPRGGGALDWLIFFDPPRHAKLRALIARAFTPRVVADLEPRIRALTTDLLDRTVERGEMDLVADFAVPLPMMVIAEMLGIPVADRGRFRQWGEAVLDLSNTIDGGPEEITRSVQGFAAAKAEAGRYLDEVLAERRSAPKDDLLSQLVEAEVDGERLTREEILGFFLLLLFAGTETTTNLLSSAILCFLEHPDQLARLSRVPELWPSAIEEVLRYRSPVQVMFRQTLRDVSMHGQVIPANQLVLVVIGSANHDPKQFAGANRFDIARDPNPHLAFGHGIHFCLGAPLARLEARVALPEILERLPGLKRAGGEPWEPRSAFHVHGPNRLPLRFEPSRPAPAYA
jgi:cytochrome P450